MRLVRFIGLAVAMVAAVGLLAACGDDEKKDGNGATATATESSEESPVDTGDSFFLEIAAENTEYDVSELNAPPGQKLTLQFDNDDPGLQHNWSLYETEESTEPIFEGEILTGVDTIDYSIDPLDAGTYHFHCDIHPTVMKGDLIVE